MLRKVYSGVIILKSLDTLAFSRGKATDTDIRTAGATASRADAGDVGRLWHRATIAASEVVGNGGRDASVSMALVVTTRPQRWRQIRLRVGAVILGREGKNSCCIVHGNFATLVFVEGEY